MPYQNISGAKSAGFPTSAEGIPMTLDQINKLASIYDAIKAGGGVDNPMGAAWSQWKKIYMKENGKWVKRKKEGKSQSFIDYTDPKENDLIP